MSDDGRGGRAKDGELLAAYCDGVTELSIDERKRVEALLAADGRVRADESDTREVIGALRELPAEGSEPDWLAMERAIRAQVGPTVPRAWWRPAWRWLVPITALATAVTILVAVLHDRGEPRRDVARSHAPEPPVAPDTLAVSDSDDVAIWLDGEHVMIDEDAVLDDVDEVLLGEGDTSVEGLLSTSDLAWIDELDDDTAAFAEHWLDERKRS